MIMTTATLLTDENGLYGFEVSGHSTQNCDDLTGKLVCAFISSAVYMAANTVTEIIGDDCKIECEDGYMRLEVATPDKRTKTVLEGLKLHLTELSVQYPEQIKIITEV